MNRYSLIFAALIAASFAVHPTRAGDAGQAAGDKKPAAPKHEGQQVSEPVAFIQEFLAKAQSVNGKLPGQPQVVFVTVPHPTETHLAAAFDHNVEALQDGLQAAGYLYDSSLVPWKFHDPRELFDDDLKEDAAKKDEDGSPGIILFRRNRAQEDPYAKGVVAFLITETPTEGIALPQVDSALKILHGSAIPLGSPIRILGPAYSGSFASMAAMIAKLHDEKAAAKTILIRSGGVTVGGAARESICAISRQMSGTEIDFGSVHHTYEDSIRTAEDALLRMSIDERHTAILSEGESLYGGSYNEGVKRDEQAAQSLNPQGGEGEADPCRVQTETSWRGIAGIWNLSFPRDISSVRAGYENQGLFDAGAPATPWKRFLNLKSDEQGEGDAVHSFGGADTVATQESVLFGISSFLKAHNIQAVIISATNEQDRYFLTQFLHANDGNVRVVVVGNTRLFMRGSTAQFRGDMMVDDFPLIPLLHDWTGGPRDQVARIFPDNAAEGTFFSALDLFADSTSIRWYPEYSEPGWSNSGAPALRPPMYIGALGNNATWPVWEDNRGWFDIGQSTPVPAGKGEPGTGEGGQNAGRDRRKANAPASQTSSWRVQMPFRLFGSNPNAHCGLIQAPSPPYQIPVTRDWKILFFLLVTVVGVYCAFFWYANPIAHGTLGSFDPLPTPQFWIFRVVIPGAVASLAFRLMAWSVKIPAAASVSAVLWWHCAELLSLLAPLAVGVSAFTKARKTRQNKTGQHKTERWMWLAPAPTALALFALLLDGFFSLNPFVGRGVDSILNTYREMHWDTGLSLVPTGLFLLLGYLIWSNEQANGAALLAVAPPIPVFPGNERISKSRTERIALIGRPWSCFSESKWLWRIWGCVAAIILIGHFTFRPFTEITSLESIWATRIVFAFSGALTCLIVLDLMQFLLLWMETRGLLQALERETFRRSFVPICDFNWRSLWTVTGVSFHNRRAINTALIDCMKDLAHDRLFSSLEPIAALLDDLRRKYNTVDLRTADRAEYAQDRKTFFDKISEVGNDIAELVQRPEYDRADEDRKPTPNPCDSAGTPFRSEGIEVAELPEWKRNVEKFLCLMYIGYIQTVVARLHSALMSISATFSLMVLGIAIYPFVPFSPLLMAGLALLTAIGCTFFKVFTEMDTNPILNRIVNGDDRKLQGNFYLKFGEALALPLLTLASSLLPGGAGRLLELVQTLLNHGQ